MKPPRNSARAPLAKNVKKLLDNAGLSEIGGQKRTGVPQKTINRMINSEGSPTLDTIDKFADGFGYKAYQILLPFLPDKRLCRLIERWPHLNSEQQEEILKRTP